MADDGRFTDNVKSGFFNSRNNDRVYNAEDMNKPYSRIVSDGVFGSRFGEKSNDLLVTPNGTMKVKVNKGQAIFGGKWFELEEDISIPISDNLVTVPRKDSIIAQVNTNTDVRVSAIIYRKGVPNTNPIPPSLENTDEIVEYRLANVLVPSHASVGNATPINEVQDVVGSEETPLVHSIIKNVDTSRWYDNFSTWMEGKKDDFDEWIDGIKQDLSSVTLIRSFNNTYVTSVQDETNIPIGISQFKRDIDILQVYINGLLLIKDREYTNNNDTNIVLANGVDRNTPISFVVYKSVDGSGISESTFRTIDNLVNLRVTSETGSTVLNALSGQDALATFLSKGKGFRTMYIQSGATNVPASGAYRAFGHYSGDESGNETAWIIVMRADGSVWSNYLNAGVWRGWKVLHEVTPNALYQSATGAFPNNNVSITPSKRLSECQHGWQLIFTGYDDTNKVARDYYTQIVSIPKRSYKNSAWNGESTAFSLVWSYGSQSQTISSCVKVFRIYDDRLESGETNSTGESRNMVLRAIYEY